MVYLLIGLIVGVILGHAIVTRRRGPKFLAIAEYWVYLPGVKAPDQTLMMDRMLARNPFVKKGRSPIGPAEGLIFSDIRLHIALVLRTKNTHVFRPDLFEEHTTPTAEHLRALAEANSMVKIRYVSEEPLPDKRHIQFLAHAADAVAELGEGQVIYDVTSERLLTREEMSQQLAEHLDATRPELHLRVVWSAAIDGGNAETRGLKKIGLEEMKTGMMQADERILVTRVLEEAASAVWRAGALFTPLEIEVFDDRFRVQVSPVEKGVAPVRILRVQQP